MSLADDLLPVVWAVRSIPGQLGLYKHTVEVGIGTWSGTHTGDGDGTITWTEIVESGGTPPKTEWLNDEELALGNLPKGSCTVGPITPAFSGGGTDLEVLNGASATTGETLKFRITGPRHPTGAIYLLAQSHEDKALHYRLVLRPVAAAATEVE